MNNQSKSYSLNSSITEKLEELPRETDKPGYKLQMEQQHKEHPGQLEELLREVEQPDHSYSWCSNTESTLDSYMSY